MAKFLFIYRQSTEKRAHPSPEEMQALQAAWYAWMQKFSSAIVVGDGLKPSGRLVKAGIVTDGPYVEAKEVIASFNIIQAETTTPRWRSHRSVRATAMRSRSAYWAATHERENDN